MNETRCTLALWFGAGALLVTMPSARGQEATLPAQFELVTLPGTYNFPVAMAFDPDGTFFVAEKRGTLRYFDGLEIQTTPVLDILEEVNSNGDRGLLGLALSPSFVADGGPLSYIYLLYTVSPIPGQDPAPGQDDKYSFSRLTRYRVETVDGIRTAIPSSRQILLGSQRSNGVVPSALASVASVHAAGTLAFASDGSLILSHGDGAWFFTDGGGLDPEGFEDFVHPVDGLRGPTPQDQDSGSFRAQDLRSLSGKILRVDPSNGYGYRSNPYFDGNVRSNASRIWALGLRNVCRFSLKPGTGALTPGAGRPNTIYAADVGWTEWEEINVIRGGENFGWPCYTGPFERPEFQALEANQHPQYVYPDCDTPTTGPLTSPVLSFTHTVAGSITPSGFDFDTEGQPGGGFTGRCVIGGTHYGGGNYPSEYDGLYFFADWGEKWIKTLETDAQDKLVAMRDFGQNIGTVDVKCHPLHGDIYLVLLSGTVRRLRYGSNATPVPVVSSGPLRGEPPLWVTFDATDSYDPDGGPLSFEWDFGDGSELSTSVFQRHLFEQRGAYDVTLTVSDPEQLSATLHLSVLVWDAPPTAQILSPSVNQPFDPTVLPPDDLEENPFDTYEATIVLQGAGSDPQGGALGFEWNVDLFTPLGVHPCVFQATGQSASFLPSWQEDGLAYYEITLTVRNASGSSGTDSRFLLPRNRLRDVTAGASPIRRLPERLPVQLIGTLQSELELMSDGDTPKPGSDAAQRQFESLPFGAPQADEWIGYELPATEEQRFTSLIFQEGLHRASGGWFEEFRVEVRRDNRWEEVAHLRVDPPYPFEHAERLGFDGESFNTYTLSFEPTFGDAVRLRGAPGGSQRFISVAELRVVALSDESDGDR